MSYFLCLCSSFKKAFLVLCVNMFFSSTFSLSGISLITSQSILNLFFKGKRMIQLHFFPYGYPEAVLFGFVLWCMFLWKIRWLWLCKFISRSSDLFHWSELEVFLLEGKFWNEIICVKQENIDFGKPWVFFFSELSL